MAMKDKTSQPTRTLSMKEASGSLIPSGDRQASAEFGWPAFADLSLGERVEFNVSRSDVIQSVNLNAITK